MLKGIVDQDSRGSAPIAERVEAETPGGAGRATGAASEGGESEWNAPGAASRGGVAARAPGRPQEAGKPSDDRGFDP